MTDLLSTFNVEIFILALLGLTTLALYVRQARRSHAQAARQQAALDASRAQKAAALAKRDALSPALEAARESLLALKRDYVATAAFEAADLSEAIRTGRGNTSRMPLQLNPWPEGMIAKAPEGFQERFALLRDLLHKRNVLAADLAALKAEKGALPLAPLRPYFDSAATAAQMLDNMIASLDSAITALQKTAA